MTRKQSSLFEEEVKKPEERLSELLPEYKVKLSKLLPDYLANKTEMDTYKKLVDKDNKEIKLIMLDSNLSECTVGDIKANCSVSERADFIEDALIAKLKEIKIRGVVKKKEYVDMDALENAIYHGKIDAASLAGCQTKKEVVTLRVTKLKKKED